MRKNYERKRTEYKDHKNKHENKFNQNKKDISRYDAETPEIIWYSCFATG